MNATNPTNELMSASAEELAQIEGGSVVSPILDPKSIIVLQPGQIPTGGATWPTFPPFGGPYVPGLPQPIPF